MGTIVKSPISVLTVGLLIGSLTLTNEVQGKTYTKCELASTLISLNVDRANIGNWICLAESVSKGNTALVTGPKTTSAYEFGIFQISSRTWCLRGRIGGRCNIPCEKFLDDYIDDDVECAKKIIQNEGFQNWDQWVKKCKGRPNATAMPNCPGV